MQNAIAKARFCFALAVLMLSASACSNICLWPDSYYEREPYLLMNTTRAGLHDQDCCCTHGKHKHGCKNPMAESAPPPPAAIEAPPSTVMHPLTTDTTYPPYSRR